MTVYESDLPGVGKKHEIELDGGERLVVVTHNTGKREVFRRESPDADAEKVFELSDDIARTVGTILEGAYFQPVPTGSIETVLGGDAIIEWYEVPAGSELAGATIADAQVRQRTGASIIAVQHGPDVTPNPAPDDDVHGGDTVVVIGSREEIEAFETAFIDADDADDAD
ncbi:cation:proton antiporter regulatory subunit [Halobaculum limi]|uniref:cation:proton antiporter regulatory subunit n=1 Tax=Halobaculum limi TaxID=3031916 RepID=UPI002405B230|nr:TrkA C-terminal domain-containing protein [Halobaculum sp. YSMS11]